MLEFKFKRKLKKDPLLYVGKQFKYGTCTYQISSYNSFNDSYSTKCGRNWTGTEEFFKGIENGNIEIIH